MKNSISISDAQGPFGGPRFFDGPPPDFGPGFDFGPRGFPGFGGGDFPGAGGGFVRDFDGVPGGAFRGAGTDTFVGGGGFRGDGFADGTIRRIGLDGADIGGGGFAGTRRFGDVGATTRGLGGVRTGFGDTTGGIRRLPPQIIRDDTPLGGTITRGTGFRVGDATVRGTTVRRTRPATRRGGLNLPRRTVLGGRLPGDSGSGSFVDPVSGRSVMVMSNNDANSLRNRRQFGTTGTAGTGIRRTVAVRPGATTVRRPVASEFISSIPYSKKL